MLPLHDGRRSVQEKMGGRLGITAGKSQLRLGRYMIALFSQRRSRRSGYITFSGLPNDLNGVIRVKGNGYHHDHHDQQPYRVHGRDFSTRWPCGQAALFIRVVGRGAFQRVPIVLKGRSTGDCAGVCAKHGDHAGKE